MKKRSVFLVKVMCGGRVLANFVNANDEADAIGKVQAEMIYGGRIVQCKWLRWCD